VRLHGGRAFPLEFAVLVIASVGLFWVMRSPGPSVPDGHRDSISFSPGHIDRGRTVAMHFDHPVDAGVVDTFLFTRWDGEKWAELHELSNGEWSPPVKGGGPLIMLSTEAGTSLTSYSLRVPGAVAPGTYLVCVVSIEGDCGLLKVD